MSQSDPQGVVIFPLATHTHWDHFGVLVLLEKRKVHRGSDGYYKTFSQVHKVFSNFICSIMIFNSYGALILLFFFLLLLYQYMILELRLAWEGRSQRGTEHYMEAHSGEGGTAAY